MQRPTPRYAALGKRLGEIFAGAGEEQADTASRLDVSQSYVSRLVAGKDRPSMQLLGRINRAYGLDELESLMRLAKFIEDPNEAPEVDTTATLAQQVAELSRKFEELSQRIDPLAQLRAQFPRARDYMWARFGAVADLCESLKLPAPAVPRFSGGSESLTHEQVDQEIEDLLEELRQEHPEFAERLKLEG